MQRAQFKFNKVGLELPDGIFTWFMLPYETFDSFPSTSLQISKDLAFIFIYAQYAQKQMHDWS